MIGPVVDFIRIVIDVWFGVGLVCTLVFLACFAINPRDDNE